MSTKSTESNCCTSLRASLPWSAPSEPPRGCAQPASRGQRPFPLRAAWGASLRPRSVRLKCLERFVAQERANRHVLTGVVFNCFQLFEKVFKTPLVNSQPRAHARAPRAPVVPLPVPVEICLCTLCLAVIVSCLVLFCSAGLWVSCPIQVAPATSHSPQGCAQTPHASCSRTRHPPPQPGCRGSCSAGLLLVDREMRVQARFLGPTGRHSRAQQSRVASGSDWLRQPMRLWGRVRPASVAPPAGGPCSLRALLSTCVLCQAESSRLNICQWVPCAFAGALRGRRLVEAVLTAMRLPRLHF